MNTSPALWLYSVSSPSSPLLMNLRNGTRDLDALPGHHVHHRKAPSNCLLTPAIQKNSTDWLFWKWLFPISARLLAIHRRGHYWINGRRVHLVAEFPSRQSQASFSPGGDAAARGWWFERLWFLKPDWTFWHSYTCTLPSKRANWVPMDILSG